MSDQARAGLVRRRVALFFASKRLAQLRVQAAHRTLRSIRLEYAGYRESNILLRRQIEAQDRTLRRVLGLVHDEIVEGLIREVLLDEEHVDA